MKAVFLASVHGGELESVCVVPLPHCLQAQGHSFRITVLTTWADLCAACHWIPSRFRPFNV